MSRKQVIQYYNTSYRKNIFAHKLSLEDRNNIQKLVKNAATTDVNELVKMAEEKLQLQEVCRLDVRKEIKEVLKRCKPQHQIASPFQ